MKRYMSEVDGVTADVHRSHDISREVFQAAMMKYQSETVLVSKMMELQQQQMSRYVPLPGVRGYQCFFSI